MGIMGIGIMRGMGVMGYGTNESCAKESYTTFVSYFP
jgi:hypothetical protein